MNILSRFLFAIGFLSFGSLAHACPDSNLDAEQSLDIFSLNQAQIYPAVLGSEIDASTCESLSEIAASGYVNSAPTLAMELGANQIGGLVFGGRSSCDTVMVVQQPDQTLLFSDDGGSAAQPLIATPGVAGTYFVWLGQYDPQEDCSASVVVSPGNQICPDTNAISQATVGLDTDALANGLALATTAGGTLDLAGCNALLEQNISAIGFTSLTPQFDFVVAETNDETLALEVPGFCDTSLLALDSNGAWHFNDDTVEGFNPRLEIPLEGLETLKVWIGTYDANACDIDLISMIRF